MKSTIVDRQSVGRRRCNLCTSNGVQKLTSSSILQSELVSDFSLDSLKTKFLRSLAFSSESGIGQGCHIRHPKAIERAGGWSCPLCLVWTKWACVKKEIIVPIYFIAITFFTVVDRRGGRQFEVVVHVSALGANGNNSECMQERT
jgi:hypothetical protein